MQISDICISKTSVTRVIELSAETSDGSTVFRFGSASEAQAGKSQSPGKPTQASATASQNGNSQSSPAPAQAPPSPEQPKRKVQTPKDGNYGSLEVC